MNRALIWKEIREQGLIVAALIVLGSGVITAAGIVLPSPNSDAQFDLRRTSEPRTLAVVLLVLASGLVVGGTLFAGEREQGTFPYLEQLPVPRWRVWRGKILAGLVLVTISTTVLFAVAAGVGIVGPPERLPFWAAIVYSMAFAAYSWGSLGSAYAKTSLAACGLGLASTLPLTMILYPACAAAIALLDLVTTGNTSKHVEYALAGTLFGLVALPLAISAWAYTAPDRNRMIRDIRTAKGLSVDPARRAPMLPKISIFNALGIRASIWIVLRQNLVLTVVLAGVSLVSGISLLQPQLPTLLIWPASTLMLGVIVGVTGWSDEQNSGSYRFWAERRMPIGRLWLAKVLYGLAFVALLVVLLGFPAGLAARTSGGPFFANFFQSHLLVDLDFPVGNYLWLWPIYGFCFGHLCGLLFRKAAVGTAVGVMVGGSLVSLWLPSLFVGGIHWYQLWIPPVLALATARLLVRSWALDQLGQRRALGRLAFGGIAITGSLMAGLTYRILEVPDVPEGNADLAFRETIPPFASNDAGREIRRGAVLYRESRQKPFPVPEPLWPESSAERKDTTIGNRARPDFQESLAAALQRGWPDDRPDADEYLDWQFGTGWAEIFAAAARLPIGTVEDATELNTNSGLRHLGNLHGAELQLLARGLQLQVRGHPEAFVESASATLGLVRNLRNKSLSLCNAISAMMEYRVHQALARWLEKLGNRPELLKEMLTLLQQHNATCPVLYADGPLPEQTTMRNSVNAPSQFLKAYLQEMPFRQRETQETQEALDNETELAAFAWVVPWEKERLRRIVGLGNAKPYSRNERSLVHGLPGLSVYIAAAGKVQAARTDRDALRIDEIAWRRGSTISVALHLYRLEHKRDVGKLDELVPKYLPTVPLDPFDDRPFRYRLSEGESIQLEKLPPLQPPTALAIGGLAGAAAVEIETKPFYRIAGGGGFSIQPPGEPDFEPLASLIGVVGLDFILGRSKDAAVPKPTHRMLAIPAGRGILWSIGPDKDDGGGRELAERVWGSSNGATKGDWIFVIPEPPETKR